MFHNKKWICSYTGSGKVDELSRELKISPLLAMVLVNRGINSAEEADRFLNPDLDNLGDPFLLPDMQVSIERIMKAIETGEKICVYGDFDVDGITSVTIMIKVLQSLGANVFYYIPDRMDEGYGLNKLALEEICQSGTNLIITVDCGIVSFEEVVYSNSLGMDIIITDHHQCQDELPSAYGVINPKRKDSDYPFEELAGVGVAYNLCRALETYTDNEGEINKLLDIVALGTVADMVPLTGENRILVKEGLKKIENTGNVGLKALVQVSGLDGKEFNTWYIAFMLAPRINAAGRLSNAKKGVELFLTDDPGRALELAKQLDEDNKERQVIEKGIFDEALKLAEKETENNVLVLASPNWHPGVIGIVASKITEKFNKPTVIFCIEEGEARGSARSIPSIDIYDLLSQCKHYYNKFGGHKQAAGLSLDAKRLEEFTREINERASDYFRDIETRPIVKTEGDLTGFRITLEDVYQLKNLEPCGFGNPAPLFAKRGVEILDARMVGKNNNHLKLVIESEDRKIDGITFGWGERPVPVIGEKADIVFVPEINVWMSKKSLQFNIRDIKKIERDTTFLTRCYSSINRLIEKENQKGKTDVSLLKEIEIKKIDDKKKFISDTFGESSGNILIVNTFRGTVDMVSTLSLYTDTCISFGQLEDYNEDKNFLLIHPVSFEKLESCKGRLFLYDSCIFPVQMEWLVNLEGVNRILLLDDINLSMKEEFSTLLPNRELLERVYKFISKNNRVEYHQCLQVMMRMGYNPMAVIRAVDTFKYSGLIKMEKCYLVASPIPEEKVDIQNTLPYSSLTKFIRLADECFNAVKKHSADL